MAAEGWFSASTHVHGNYGGNLHNSLENLIMMSEAEDQDLVLHQVANKDNRVLDYQHFEPGGGAHSASTPEHPVVVGQEYRPPFYGHVFMFRMRDHLISPFTMGYEGTAIESLYPSNTDMFRKAKAQGAVVGYVHAFTGENDPLDGNLGGAKGFLVDAALGTTDAVEWSDAGRDPASSPSTRCGTTGCASPPPGARTRSATCNARSWWGPCAPTSTPGTGASTSTPGSRACGRGGRSSRRGPCSS